MRFSDYYNDADDATRYPLIIEKYSSFYALYFHYLQAQVRISRQFYQCKQSSPVIKNEIIKYKKYVLWNMVSAP